jgi:DNA-binding NarL/FixJ family response regulator
MQATAVKPFQVYIVEDSVILRRLLIDAIQAQGAEVNGCSGDAATAIEDLFVLQPNLVVIDISLSTGTGFDVLKAMRDHALVPDAIKVVLTNYASADYEERSAQLGADRFFDKSLETGRALDFIGAQAATARNSSALRT